MKISKKYFLLILLTGSIMAGCGSRGFSIKKKEKEIQSFLDSTKYLTLHVEIKESQKDKDAYVININGKGGVHHEIYDVDTKKYLAMYIVHRFFRNNVIPDNKFLVFQYSHENSPNDATWFMFKKDELDRAKSYFDGNPCFAKQMNYMLKEFDPEEYIMLSIGLEGVERELKNIKKDYQISDNTFLESIYVASAYSCNFIGVQIETPDSVRLNNMGVLKTLLLGKKIRDMQQQKEYAHLKELNKIGNIKDDYELGYLLGAFIMVDSLGIFKPSEFKKAYKID